jgi:hypothetical protein
MLMAAPNIQTCECHVLTGVEAIPAPNESYVCACWMHTNYAPRSASD